MKTLTNRCLSLSLICLVLGSTALAQSRARRSLSAPLPTSNAERELRRTPVVRAVQKAAPSVISVYVKRVGNTQAFFSDLDPRFRLEGQGSGVIIDEEGLALTNWHVVATATYGDGLPRPDRQVEVRLRNGKTWPAQVLSTSPDKDLALLRLRLPVGKKLQAVELGDSDTLMMGETVIAIGNPLGQANTVTVGRLSARDRSIGVHTPDRRVRKYAGLLQTDAAINPGNSGGALIDLTGKLIGINNAKANGAPGIGFSIPVNTVRATFKNDLLSIDRLRGVYLGIVLQDDTESAVISKVLPHSPAAAAGLRPGDRILSLMQRPVGSHLDLARVRLYLQADRAADLRYRRGAKEETVQLRPMSHMAWSLIRQTGLELETVNTDRRMLISAGRALRRHLGGNDYVPGAVLRVRTVHDDSPAGKLGVRKGDVLLGFEVPIAGPFGQVQNQLVTFESLESLDRAVRVLSQRRRPEFNTWILRGKEVLDGPLRLRKARAR